MDYVTYRTARVADGRVKVGDRVYLPYTPTHLEEDEGFAPGGIRGIVSRIIRWRPIRANKIDIELADEDGEYLTTAPARAIHKHA